MGVFGTSGSLKTADAPESIPLYPNQFREGKLPTFREVSKIREIIYCAYGLCGGKTYTIRHKKTNPSGFGGKTVGGDRRLLPIYELGRIDQFPWIIVFETSTKGKSPVVTAMQFAFQTHA